MDPAPSSTPDTVSERRNAQVRRSRFHGLPLPAPPTHARAGSPAADGAGPFRLLFEAATDPALILDAEGVVLFANRALRGSVSLDGEDVEGRSIYDFVHPYDHAALQAWLRRMLDGTPHEAASRQRLSLIGADGGEIPVEGAATVGTSEDGSRVERLHLLLVDLSERERHAREQRETTELFHLLSQHAPWGVFITDPVGRLRFANRHWRSLADLLHVPSPRGVWWQMVHPMDRDRVLAQWHAALAGNHEFSAEFRVNVPDSEPRWVRTRVAPSWTPAGQRGACVGITEDITLQRQADDVLRRAHEQLEELVGSRTRELNESNRELTELVYAVTHDLKAPLRGISRLADWLIEDHAASLPPEGTTLISKIQSRVRQLHALLDGMLAYSRVGRTHEPEIPVDPNSVIAAVTRLLDPPTSFAVILRSPLPTISGIPQQLQQVFHSLLDNAIKFSDKPKGRVQISCQRAGAAWEFSVADNGPGIPARYHEKIFGLFQRLDPSPDRPGAGIGLTLVKRIVETRGGRVYLSSEEGHGTTVHFTWPDAARRPSHR